MGVLPYSEKCPNACVQAARIVRISVVPELAEVEEEARTRDGEEGRGGEAAVAEFSQAVLGDSPGGEKEDRI